MRTTSVNRKGLGQMTKPRVIPAGERRGRLVVTTARRNGEKRLQCRCDCGNQSEVDVNEWSRVQSCGCLTKERAAAALTALGRHGMSGTPEYRSWSGMIDRTTNPNSERYADYGGRGITVCERWRDFANFYSDMGPRPPGHSLDRIDNNSGYAPDNCRWATAYVQVHNRRPPRKPPARWAPVGSETTDPERD